MGCYGTDQVVHSQARNQLGNGAPGGAKCFLRGAQIFKTMCNSFKLFSIHFSRGQKFCRGTLLPLVTGLYTVHRAGPSRCGAQCKTKERGLSEQWCCDVIVLSQPLYVVYMTTRKDDKLYWFNFLGAWASLYMSLLRPCS